MRRALLAFVLALASCTTMDVPPIPLDLLGGAPDADARTRETLETSFARASAQYEQRQYDVSARSFMDAAAAARADEALTTARCSCYRNAAKAWRMAETLDAHRALLDEAARDDAPCAGEIQAILNIFTDHS